MSPKNISPDKQPFLTREKKIIILFVIPAVVFAVISCREGLDDQQIAGLADRFNFAKLGAPTNGAIITFLLLLFGLFAFIPIIRWVQKLFSALTGKYFVISLASLAVLGAVAALYIPSYTSLFKTDTQQSTSSTQNGQGSGNQQNQSSKDPSSDLRLHLLYITGGIIAVLGLIETNRKNSQDHIRQVHAARRERYIEAVDKLSSEQAPVRLGGVYALVGLADEWLDDDNIGEETRIEEGQVIINNLCAYIRSPFPLAEKVEEYEAHEKLEDFKRKEPKSLSPLGFLRLNFLNKYFIGSNDDKKIEQITADYAKFHEEQDVRRTIFVEMDKRSSVISNGVTVTPGAWSEFDFDFSRAPIFYPLSTLTIEKGNFSSAKFYSKADFSWATFTQIAAFNGATFTQNANFNGATFTQAADFYEAVFTQNADFSWATFTQDPDFRGVTFTQTADFNGATFTQTATFSEATFTQTADFSWATFTQIATFSEATFIQTADFSGVTFTQDIDFSRAIFTQTADFSWATFVQDANFAGATFAQKLSFKNAFFKNCAPTFTNKILITRFSVHTAQQDYDFSVRNGSKPIQLGKAKLDGVKRRIPVGTVLVDPDSGRISKPAK